MDHCFLTEIDLKKKTCDMLKMSIVLNQCLLGFIFGATATEHLAAAVLAALHKLPGWSPLAYEELDGIFSCLRYNQEAYDHV